MTPTLPTWGSIKYFWFWVILSQSQLTPLSNLHSPVYDHYKCSHRLLFSLMAHFILKSKFRPAIFQSLSSYLTAWCVIYFYPSYLFSLHSFLIEADWPHLLSSICYSMWYVVKYALTWLDLFRGNKNGTICLAFTISQNKPWNIVKRKN